MSRNRDIKDIFDHWNQAGIIVHKRLDRKMANVIGSILDDGYTKEELIEAIDTYSQVLHSNDTTWTYKWRVEEFFQRTPGFRHFLPEAEPFKRFVRDGSHFGTGSTTPPVLSVSPSLKQDFLNKKTGGFKND